MSKKGKIALGTLIAAGAGYVIGLLTAPKSGRETRKDIRSASLKAKAEAEKKLKTAHSELTVLLAEAEKKVKTSKDQVSKEVKAVLEQADTVRQKSRELLSAIHEGEAEDGDLQKAVDDAKDSITHLKKYIGKKISNK